MREIKFRGMTEAGEWIYGGYVTRNNAHYILDGKCDHVEIDGREANILHFHIVKYKTVGEYTGLKDKNGKEEYQFDITRNKYGQIRHIDWYCGAWWLMFPDGRNDKPLYGSHSAQEVIGNIYENGDLIK